MGWARSQKSKSFFKGGFFLNHLLDGPFTGSAPFARQFIERRGTAQIFEKNSGEWDKDPFARQAIRIWACQPNNPHPSTYFSTPCYLFSITIWFSHTEQILYLSIPSHIWNAQRRGRGHSSAPMGGPFLKWWSWLPDSWLAVLSVAFLPCHPSAAHIYSPSPFKKNPGKRALHMIISWALSKDLLWSWPLLPGKSEKENWNILQASKKKLDSATMINSNLRSTYIGLFNTQK